MTTPRPLATVQAADAHQAATRDRRTTADLILRLALDEAEARIRRGLPIPYVAARLEQATHRADRILGPTIKDPS